MVALLVSLLYYRGFPLRDTVGVVADGLRSAGTIMLIVATALAFGHWMTESGIPAQLVRFTVEHHFTTWEFLLAINVLLLVLGCFLEVDLHPAGDDPHPGPGAEAARRRPRALRHHLHPQHGDRR